MKIDLDDLERCATAASKSRGDRWSAEGNDVVEDREEPMRGIIAECGGKAFWSDFPEIAAHIAAADPATVLALVRVVRAADAYERADSGKGKFTLGDAMRLKQSREELVAALEAFRT